MPLMPAAPDLSPGLDAGAYGTGDAGGRAPLQLETVRRQFDRRAARFAAHDAVVREVERRMCDRLSYIKVAPRRVLDVGCGQGASRAAFARAYPEAQWVGADLSLQMLRAAVSRHEGAGLAGRLAGVLPRGLRARLRERSAGVVCADAAQLPFADASVDLLFSNLMLHWHPQPHRLFPEFKRVLAGGGLLMFSCFGPDTLAELRSAWRDAGLAGAPVPFIDMHDFGDMLVASGFATPVMDAEHLTLTYPSAQALLREVAMLGGNPRADRPRALPSGGAARSLLCALESRRDAGGRIALTFEVAYGHAWKPAAPEARRAADGTVTVPLERLRDQLGRRRA